MAVTVLAENYIIGPADIYWRERGVLTEWNSMGATLDDAAMRIVSEWFVPDNISGLKGPVVGLDVQRRLNAEFEFTVPDFVGGNMDAIFPGSRVTAEEHGDTVATPYVDVITTTAAAAGDRSVTGSSATNLAVGDFIRIGSGAGVLVEYRQITDITGFVHSFRDPLLFAHALGEDLVETDGDYRTLYESSLYTRMPSTAYKEWAMVMANGNGYSSLTLPSGLSVTETGEVTVGDNALSGIRVMVSGRRDGTTPNTSPYQLHINESVGPA